MSLRQIHGKAGAAGKLKPVSPPGRRRAVALEAFLVENRERIIARTQGKVAGTRNVVDKEAGLASGIPRFLSQIVGMLQTPSQSDNTEIGEIAARHGDDLHKIGVTVEEVVHDYGGLCQSITEIAVEEDVTISSSDFQTLNACLDFAIAAAVSQHGRQREQSVSDGAATDLGVLAHELRNALHGATMAFDAIREGKVGLSRSTSGVLHRSLLRMGVLVDRALAEVRMMASRNSKARMSIATLLDEVVAMAQADAQDRGVQLTIAPVESNLWVDVDRHSVLSALENILQNAVKFTRPHGCIALRTVATEDRVLIEIEDECGGLPTGQMEELFRAFGQLGADRSGLGLGLTISRDGIEASGGTITVRDLPGKGCVFSIDLPRQA